MRGAAAALALAASLIFAASGALACMVCIARPEATLADRLIRAEAVVLMREDPERPFSYAALTVLKGEARGRAAVSG